MSTLILELIGLLCMSIIMMLLILKVLEEIAGTFYEKELRKTNQKEFRIEKVIKRKDDKLYFKWKSYDNSFNNSIDKKDLMSFSWLQLYKNESIFF